jgi:hypothetical protein
MATYNWTISQLERQTDTGGVVTAHYRCNATEGDYTAGSYGTAGFTPDPTAPDFKPYDQLTEADVLAWVWASVDRAETEANLATQIEAQKAFATVTGTPWV